MLKNLVNAVLNPVEIVGLTSDEKSEQSNVVKYLKKAGADCPDSPYMTSWRYW
jgi:hypothetical protein